MHANECEAVDACWEANGIVWKVGEMDLRWMRPLEGVESVAEVRTVDAW